MPLLSLRTQLEFAMKVTPPVGSIIVVLLFMIIHILDGKALDKAITTVVSQVGCLSVEWMSPSLHQRGPIGSKHALERVSNI